MKKGNVIFLLVTAIVVLLHLIPYEYLSMSNARDQEMILWSLGVYVVSALIALLATSVNKADRIVTNELIDLCSIRFTVSQKKLNQFNNHFKNLAADKEKQMMILFSIVIASTAIVLSFFGFSIIILSIYAGLYIAFVWYLKEYLRPESHEATDRAVIEVGISEERAIVGNTFFYWGGKDMKLEDVIFRKINSDLYYLAVYYNEYIVAQKGLKNGHILAPFVSDYEDNIIKKPGTARIPVPASQYELVKPLADQLLVIRNSTSVR